MPTREEDVPQTPEQRLERMARTADDLEEAVKGQSDAAVSRRPDPKELVGQGVYLPLARHGGVFLLAHRAADGHE